MIAVLVIMVAVLLIAAAVVAYAAYPARGHKVPGVPWLGDAMASVADAVPTLDVHSDDGGDGDDVEEHPEGRSSSTVSR